MLRLLLVFGFACAVAFPPPLAQQNATRDPNASRLLQKAFNVGTSGTSVVDVTLTADVTRTAGSLIETGNGVFRAAYGGFSRTDLTFPSGSFVEVRGLLNGESVGNWNGTDGMRHRVASSNIWTDVAWFYPQFLIQQASSDASWGLSYVGLEMKSGSQVEHLLVWRTPAFASQLPPELQQVGVTDVYLDAQSLLPAEIAYSIHPDSASAVNIPIQVEYSDYHTTQGLPVAFHVQRFLNNGLISDVNVTDVRFNSAIASAVFAVE